MLDPNSDYTAIKAFDLYARRVQRHEWVTPDVSCSQGAGTAGFFFRFTLDGARVKYQKIAWSDILLEACWQSATDPFTDPIEADVRTWYVCELTATKILLVYRLQSDNITYCLVHDDETGWGTPVARTTSTYALLCAIPHFGFAAYVLEGGVDTLKMIRYTPSNDALGLSFTLDKYESLIQAFGWWDDAPIVMLHSAGADGHKLYHFYGASYFYQIAGGPVSNPSFQHQEARACGIGIQYTQAGETLFQRENGIISHGYHPFALSDIYLFDDLPCADQTNEAYWCADGVYYSFVNTRLGQISAFQQDRMNATITVPEVDPTWETASDRDYATYFLRRTYNNDTTADNPAMILTNWKSTPWKSTFVFAKYKTTATVAPLLAHLARLQPHLLFDAADIPFCPLAFDNAPRQIAEILDAYKLHYLHDQQKLAPSLTDSADGTLTYERYEFSNKPQRRVLITYYNEYDLDPTTRKLKTEILPGKHPPITHHVGFIPRAIGREALIPNAAFSSRRATFERPPQHFQVGDVIETDQGAGLITNLRESFAASQSWRQTIEAQITTGGSLKPLSAYGELIGYYQAFKLGLDNNAEVSIFADQSGQVNHFGSPGLDHKPSYIAINEAANNYPVIRFGSGDFMTCPTIVPDGALSWFLVWAPMPYRYSNLNHDLITRSSTNYWLKQYGDEWRTTGADTINAPIQRSAQRFYLFSSIYGGGTLKRYYNGTLLHSQTFSNDIPISNLGQSFGNLNGEIAELAIFNDQLTGRDLAAVHAQMIETYQIQ